MSSRKRVWPSVASSRLARSWTSWLQKVKQARRERLLHRTRMQLRLLAGREAALLLEVTLAELEGRVRELRVRELLADLSTPEPQPPQPEPLSPEERLAELTSLPPALPLPVMHRPEQLEPDPPPATDQLRALLSGTTPSSESSSAS